MAEPLPISTLIHDRIKELGLSWSQFLSRLGYSNTSKAHRRLQQLLDGRLDVTRNLIARLPDALALPSEAVLQAVEATRDHLVKVRQQADRRAFKPDGIVLTERTVPTSLALAAFANTVRWKKIDLDLAQGPDTFVDQAMVVVRSRMQMFGGSLPYWGRIIGFAVNSSFDLQVRCDLDGKVVDAFPYHYRLGEISFEIGRGQSVMHLLRG